MNAVDMSAFIAAKSDQLNADDLMDAPRTITITKVTAAPDAAEQPVSIHYEGGEGRPWKPCKTMRRILVGVWGKDASKYVGRSLTLYRDPTVAFGGLQVGGIRVSHMSDITEDKTVALLVTRGRKAPFKIKPLKDAPRQQTSDFSGQLAELKSLAKPGNTEALGAKWQEIGPDARKALAAELPALKAACSEQPAEDVPFDAQPASLAEQIAETPAQAAVERFKAQLESATDAAAVETIIAEAEKHRDAFDDQLVMSLEVAFSQARSRFAEPVQGELVPSEGGE
jgi:hypothetical protein